MTNLVAAGEIPENPEAGKPTCGPPLGINPPPQADRRGEFGPTDPDGKTRIGVHMAEKIDYRPPGGGLADVQPPAGGHAADGESPARRLLRGKERAGG